MAKAAAGKRRKKARRTAVGKGARRGAVNAAMEPESYWSAVRRPVYALAFLLPMMLVYEFGVVMWGRRGTSGTGELRNGADWFVRHFLVRLADVMGWSGLFLSGAVVIATLFAWQIVLRHSWSLRSDFLVGMTGESLLYAFPLPLIYVFAVSGLVPAALSSSERFYFDLTLSFGAGIYEEFLFRLVLVTGLAAGLHYLGGMGRSPAMFVSVVLAAFIFSGAHYVGLGNDPFHWSTFTYRAILGLVFGALYVTRGFGIAAGCHAWYDILVYVLLVGR